MGTATAWAGFRPLPQCRIISCALYRQRRPPRPQPEVASRRPSPPRRLDTAKRRAMSKEVRVKAQTLSSTPPAANKRGNARWYGTPAPNQPRPPEPSLPRFAADITSRWCPAACTALPNSAVGEPSAATSSAFSRIQRRACKPRERGRRPVSKTGKLLLRVEN